MKLTDLMNKELIDISLSGITQDDIIDELIDKLDQANALHSKSDFKQAILTREQQGSTGIGFEIAIPHGKSNAVKTPQVTFGIKQNGVNWNSADGKDAKLIFMIAVPEESAGNEHLKILQMLARKLMNEQFRTSLINAKSVDEAYDLLAEIQ
ncbi:hypothetical protein CVD25_00470 [Bacillus canaveralius]|uniref:PTS EIIA type-2 domain-containing protein n=1 Tax=Bacillus canaveralius TaxID=1403243 RepID=A0A2N5GQ89_9BACI|nr:hypothetical protein CU635_04515 [Bacillus canaveralius]PLS00954.1 hypothetical protein CVD25_00470 [Bacillus canaveralius]RSK54180.1 hypothetical protein EJA13_06295 [Bacillus canaveralius]